MGRGGLFWSLFKSGELAATYEASLDRSIARCLLISSILASSHMRRVGISLVDHIFEAISLHTKRCMRRTRSASHVPIPHPSPTDTPSFERARPFRKMRAWGDREKEILNEKLQQFYTDNRVQHRLPKLRLSNIRGSKETDFPQLRGKIVKSASTKALVPFLQQLAAEFDTGTPWTQHRRKACDYLQQMYTILDEGAMFLEEGEIVAFKRAVLKFSSHYNCLAVNGSLAGNLFFNVVPKHHYLQHLCMMCEMINPRFMQCYKEESFVGRVTALYASCASGPLFCNSTGNLFVEVPRGSHGALVRTWSALCGSLLELASIYVAALSCSMLPSWGT